MEFGRGGDKQKVKGSRGRELKREGERNIKKDIQKEEIIKEKETMNTERLWIEKKIIFAGENVKADMFNPRRARER